jgi:hypothetical protein
MSDLKEFRYLGNQEPEPGEESNEAQLIEPDESQGSPDFNHPVVPEGNAVENPPAPESTPATNGGDQS